MAKSDLVNKIENKIYELRHKMISTAQIKGLNHPDTIKCSEELDIQLNQYEVNKFTTKN